MRGQMMDMPLLVSSLIEHADRNHGDVEIVSRTVEGPIHRCNYSQAHQRAKRLAQALTRLGVKGGAGFAYEYGGDTVERRAVPTHRRHGDAVFQRQVSDAH